MSGVQTICGCRRCIANRQALELPDRVVCPTSLIDTDLFRDYSYPFINYPLLQEIVSRNATTNGIAPAFGNDNFDVMHIWFKSMANDELPLATILDTSYTPVLNRCMREIIFGVFPRQHRLFETLWNVSIAFQQLVLLMRSSSPYLRLEMENDASWVYIRDLSDERLHPVRRFEMKAWNIGVAKCEWVANLWKRIPRPVVIMFHAVHVIRPAALLVHFSQWQSSCGLLWEEVQWYCENLDAFPVLRRCANLERLVVLGNGEIEDVRAYTIMRSMPSVWHKLHSLHAKSLLKSFPEPLDKTQLSTRILTVMASDSAPKLRAVCLEGPGGFEDVDVFLTAHSTIESLALKNITSLQVPLIPTLPSLTRLDVPASLIDETRIESQPMATHLVLNMYSFSITVDIDDLWAIVAVYAAALRRLVVIRQSFPVLETVTLTNWPSSFMRTARLDRSTLRDFTDCMQEADTMGIALLDSMGRRLSLGDLRFRPRRSSS